MLESAQKRYKLINFELSKTFGRILRSFVHERFFADFNIFSGSAGILAKKVALCSITSGSVLYYKTIR